MKKLTLIIICSLAAFSIYKSIESYISPDIKPQNTNIKEVKLSEFGKSQDDSYILKSTNPEMNSRVEITLSKAEIADIKVNKFDFTIRIKYKDGSSKTCYIKVLKKKLAIRYSDEPDLYVIPPEYSYLFDLLT